MRTHLKHLLPALCCASLAAPAAAAGQAPAVSAPWQTGTGVTYEFYSFATPEAIGIQELRLLTLPVAARANLFGNSAVTVSGAYASGTLVAPDGAETTVEGLTDTYVTLDVPVSRDLLVLSAIVALPTGKATLGLEEAQAAGAFAADLLPFRVTSWGSGGAAGMAATLSHAAGGFGLGVSAGYSAAQEFTPLAEDERAYRPGNEMTFRVAIDRTIGRSGKASLKLGAQRYGDDHLGGSNLYRSGDRYSAVGSYAFAAGGRSSGAVYGGVLHRTEGSYLDGSAGFGSGEDLPSQDLVLLGAGLRLPVGSGTLSPSVDGRIFRSSDGVGQGYVTGVGAAYQVPVGAVRVGPSVRGRFGKVIARENAESGITGLDAGLLVQFGGRR